MIEGQFGEIDRYWEPSHVLAVRAALEANFEHWFARYCVEAPVGHNRFAKGNRSTQARPATDAAAHLTRRAQEDVELYEKSATVYREFLAPEAMAQYDGQMRIFAQQLSTQLPVINKALNGQMEEMVWWKKRFRALMRLEPKRLHTLCQELVAFADDYRASLPAGEDFLSLTETGQLALEPMNHDPKLLDEQRGEGEAAGEGGTTCGLSIAGTVSAGITSMMLHMLDGAHFAPRTRHMLAALFFLSGRGDFGLGSSEFVLWSVKRGDLGHNHHYPYPLFMLHVLAVARLLRGGFRRHGVPFPGSHAMVLTASFLQFVADANARETADWKGDSEC